MTPVNEITKAGIGLANEIVDAAARTGLSLNRALAMVEKESRGRNVWGSDPVSTGGTYSKGAVVTRQAYEAYRAKRRAGQIGMQGVGPCQLTWWELQDRADSLGGCWDPRVNLRVGFEHLKRLQDRYGVRDGFRRYNGSGPAAERYADDAMKRAATWAGIITTKPAPTAKAIPGRPMLAVGSTGPDVLFLQRYMNRVFPAYSKLVVDGWFGKETEKVVIEFQKRVKIKQDGIVGPVTWARLGLSN